jgi:glutaminyl-tRNA synthetase
MAKVNPNSLTVLKELSGEASLSRPDRGDNYQFYGRGYYCADLKDHAPANLVFIVLLV